MQKLAQAFGLVFFFSLPVICPGQSLQVADSLRLKAEGFHERGSFKEAELYYKQAYDIYKKHEYTHSFLLTAIYYGEVLSYRSKIDQAINLFNGLKKNRYLADNDSLKARVESDLGWAYNRLGKREIGLQYYRKALQHARKANDTLMISLSINNLAAINSKDENFEQALALYKQALQLARETNNLRSQALILDNIGSVYKKTHIYDKALTYFNQSIKIAKELENVSILAAVFENIGDVYQDKGELEKGLYFMHKSLEYRRQANNPQGTAETLNHIGTLYNDIGNSEMALEYYLEDLSISKKLSNPFSISTSYNNIGRRLWDIGRKEEALKYFIKALSLRREIGNPRLIASSLLELARVEISRGNTSKAYSYVSETKAIADSTQNPTLQNNAFLYLGIIDFHNAKYNAAISNYKKALKYSRIIGTDHEIDVLKKLASAYNQLDSDRSIFYGQQAIDLIEQSRTKAGTLSQFKTGYFKKHAQFYIDLASWVLSYGRDIPRAFQLVESAKARALTEELASAMQRLDESLPEKERLKRAAMRSDITRLQIALDNNRNQSKRDSLKKIIRNKELAQASFEHHLKQQYPEYKLLKTPEIISLEQAQQMCGSETAILEYGVNNDRIIIFLITRENVQAKQFAISSGDSSHQHLASKITRFRNAIINRMPEDTLAKLSEPLYNHVIAPFQYKLDAYENLIIIPDGALAYLPFGALKNKTNYLVSDFSIKYAPSLTGFSLIREPNEKLSDNLLAIGNASNYSSASYSALPSVAVEIKEITSLFPRATIMNDGDISEAAVKKEIQKEYSHVHVAAHSVINEQNTSLSSIILGGEEHVNKITNDGYLRNDEIYGLNISSQMVVLSACKSGIGTIINGEGMLGLQRAFFNAGASSLIVSLWDVYDRSTTHFMKNFYSSLMDENQQSSWSDSWQSLLRWVGWDHSIPFGNAASAIRATKLTMLEHPRYHHPVYWAPFIVVGR